MTPANGTDAPIVDFEVIEQPDLPLIKQLVAYWEKKRGMRLAPCRADVDPVELRMHLPNIFMVDVLDGGADFRYRLIGAAIVAGLGRALPDRLFDALQTRMQAHDDSTVLTNDEVDVMSLDRVDTVVGPSGLEAPGVAARRADCPIAPELLRAG